MTKSEKLRLLGRATVLEAEDTNDEDLALAQAMGEMFESAAAAYEADKVNGQDWPGRCAEAIWNMARLAKDGQAPGYWEALRTAVDAYDAEPSHGA